MLHKKKNWIIGILITLVIFAVPIAFVAVPRAASQRTDNPRAHLPKHPMPTDHSGFFKDADFKTGQDVTEACLACHPEAGQDMMKNNHFTWTHKYGISEVPGVHDNVLGLGDTVLTGKKYVINNFCITIKPNWPACTACHAGYGWKDDTFNFDDPTNIDCLACHDNTGYYVKSQACPFLTSNDGAWRGAGWSYGSEIRARNVREWFACQDPREVSLGKAVSVRPGGC